MEYELIPITKKYYDNEVRISNSRKRTRKLKLDQLEIDYYRRILNRDIIPNLRMELI